MSDRSSVLQEIQKTREALNAVSPYFCLAKWKQVTVLLHNGTTHSCAHPSPHPIPLEEIRLNPSALHNTNFKKEQRKKMLCGEKPKECQYCWNIEESGNHFSDRHMKSNEFWAREYLTPISKMRGDENVNPSYLEVSFSNTCQFKCSYCFPQVSSKWMKETEDFGPYLLSGNHKYHDLDYLKQAQLMPLKNEEENPYIKAFWDWMPTLYPDLKMLRITGGEPLLSNNTFKVLDWVVQNPHPNLTVAINSNLGVADNVLERFIEKVEHVPKTQKLLGLDIFTSVDTSGPQAEYIRNGLNYDKFLLNIRKLFDSVERIKIGIMCTYNALSIPQFRGLLQDVLELRKAYPSRDMWRLWLDVGYVRYPPFQSVQIITPELREIMKADLAFMKENRVEYFNGAVGFYDVEIEKMSRLIQWSESPIAPDLLKTYRADFYRFFKEQDRRRNTDIEKTFPEMHEFFKICRQANEDLTR